MVNLNEVQETNRMIEEENLDVRTITMGISLLTVPTQTVQRSGRRSMTRLQEKRKTL